MAAKSKSQRSYAFRKGYGEGVEDFVRIALPDIEEMPSKTSEPIAIKKPELSASHETENSIESSGVGSYSVEC